MTESSLHADLMLALHLADTADSITHERFRSADLEVTTKPDHTPVTDADQAVESAIRAILAAERAEDSILGEEFGTAGSSTRQWIIDPIDGTANFLRGVPVWATLIALAIDGTPVLGVVSAPALAKRWWAATGQGAYVQDAAGARGALATENPGDITGRAGLETRRIRVSQVAKIADASTALSGLQRWEQAGKLEQYLRLTRQAWRTRDYGDAWAYMLVAEGLVDVAGEYDLKPYDMAALMPIIHEAGGRFTSAEGAPGIWHGSALATNSLIHDAVLDVLTTP